MQAKTEREPTPNPSRPPAEKASGGASAAKARRARAARVAMGLRAAGAAAMAAALLGAWGPGAQGAREAWELARSGGALAAGAALALAAEPAMALLGMPEGGWTAPDARSSRRSGMFWRRWALWAARRAAGLAALGCAAALAREPALAGAAWAWSGAQAASAALGCAFWGLFWEAREPRGDLAGAQAREAPAPREPDAELAPESA